MLRIKKASFFGCYFHLDDIPRLPQVKVVFAGRSNVGKSSMINTLVNMRNLARVGKHPGKTRSVNFYLINDSFFFVDLPGYGYAKVSKKEKARWGSLVEGFLKRERFIKGAFILLDIRRDPGEEEFMLMDFFRSRRIPYVLVLTKADKLGRNQRGKRLKELSEILSLESAFLVPFSSKTREGRDKVLDIISSMTGIKD